MSDPEIPPGVLIEAEASDLVRIIAALERIAAALEATSKTQDEFTTFFSSKVNGWIGQLGPMGAR